MPVTPSTDAPTQGTNTPDEAPTRRTRQVSDEAPTRRRAPPSHGYPASRQAVSSSPQPGGYAAPQQPGAFPAQPRGSATPQQGSPRLEQRGYMPRAMGAPSPQYDGSPPLYQEDYQAAQRGYPSTPGTNMPAIPDQQSNSRAPAGPSRAAPYVQYFYSPQVQPSAGTPHQSGVEAFSVQGFWRAMGLLGQVAGVGGFLLLICFFLPWFFTPDFTSGSINGKSSTPTVSYSGWHTASGLPLFDRTSSFTLFPHLWLVLACALALVALGMLLGARRIRLRLAAILASALSLGALLLEFLFLIQASSIQEAVVSASNEKLTQTMYGVSWGFWLAVITTIVGLGVGSFTSFQASAGAGRRSVPRST